MPRIWDNACMLEIDETGDNIYPVLLFGGSSLALVDTGFPGQLDELESAIREAGFEPEGLTHILLTHQDIDHIGCAKALRALAPNSKLYAHALEAPYISGEKTPIKLAALLQNYAALDEGKKQAADNLKVGFAASFTAVDEALEDGDVIDIAGGLEVVHTPGHTPGHVCFVLGDLLLSGDALLVSGDELKPPVAHFTQNMDQALASLKKLGGRGIREVVSYHGGHWCGDDFERKLAAVVALGDEGEER